MMKMVRTRKREEESAGAGDMAGGSSLKVAEAVTGGEKGEWSGLTSSAVKV